MAMQTANSVPAPSAQVVGNAFVEQYYHIIHHSPELAYRFYMDTSVLSRPNNDGTMATATTIKGINDVLCSMDYKNYKAEIKTADAQDSFKDGVVVLVTGSLTGDDLQKRKFTQTFFLAPQDNGYYVLNDVFRYVEEREPEITAGLVAGVDATPPTTLTQDPEPGLEVDRPQPHVATALVGEIDSAEEKDDGQVIDEKSPPQDRDRDIVVEPVSRTTENHVSVDSESVISALEEDAPKKSYASIVSSQTKKGPTKVYVPANVARAAPAKVEKQSVNQAPPSKVSTSDASVPPQPAVVPESDYTQDREEDEGYSIFIRNLPLNATVQQVEAEFKKFGPIKLNGIQVRSNKQDGLCFGFVKFREWNSMQSAIKASPITIGDRQAAVEVKRNTSRAGGMRSRFAPTRGSFHNENTRGRGNVSGGRTYVRSDSLRNRGNFAGGRTGEAYQQGRGRGVFVNRGQIS